MFPSKKAVDERAGIIGGAVTIVLARDWLGSCC
jgi:hypothetical protein